MEAALRLIEQGGGTVLRRPGGYWTPAGRDHVPDAADYVGTQTIEALEARGLVTVNWRGTPSAVLAKTTGSAA
jgi:hypothetical protein